MVEIGQRWVCVRTARRGTVIDIVGNRDLPEGTWWYVNVSASRSRQYGKITEEQLAKNWKEI